MQTRFFFTFLLAFVCVSSSATTNALREVNLRIRDLVYDSVTHKLYATSPDHLTDLLQLDPQSGAITATFPVGAVPFRLVLDNRRGVWIGLNGEGMVRRFHLDTLTAEPKFDFQVGANMPILDIAPSPNDPDTFAVIAGRTYLVRDGVLSPDSLATPFGSRRIVMLGNYLFSNSFRARMTPSGLVVDGQGLGTDFEMADGRFYLENGQIIDPFTLQSVGSFEHPVGAVSYGFGVNSQDNSILFLSFGRFAVPFYLTRFDRTTRELTGFFAADIDLGNIWETDLVPISTNRVAMWSDQKLFFVDLNLASQHGDVSVTASAQSNHVDLGGRVEHTITITNHGPGYVFNTPFTNILVGDVRFGRYPGGGFGVNVPPGSDPSRLPWQTNQFSSWTGGGQGVMEPGYSETIRFHVTPLATGTYTNRIVVAAENETNSANNVAQSVVTVQNAFTNFIARLAPSGPIISQLAYDPQGDQLLLGTTNTEIEHGRSRGQLFFVDLDEARIEVPLIFGGAIDHISTAPELRNAWVNVAGWSSLYQVFLDNGFIGPEYRVNGSVRDLDASPVDRDVAAFSGTSAIRLFDINNFLGTNTAIGAGAIQFSSDGRKLYQVLDFDCSLRVFTATNGALTLDRTFPDVGCYEFFESGGRLYFDSGLVFDPSTGTTVTNLNLPFPSFVLRDPAGALNVLTRTNTDWIVRRLDLNSFEETGRVHIGRDFSPTIAISAGTNRIAFRDRSGEAVLVRFVNDPSIIRLDALNTSGGITVRFSSAAAARYRLEESASIVDPVWSQFGEEFTGNGFLIERTAPTPGGRRFFRVVRLN